MSDQGITFAEPVPPPTVESMRERINLLSDEIDANEEENRLMQDEIDGLYEEIDKLEKGAPC